MRYSNDEIAHERRMAWGQIIVAGVLIVGILFLPVTPFYWIALGVLLYCILIGVFDLWVIRKDPGDPPLKDDLDDNS